MTDVCYECGQPVTRDPDLYHMDSAMNWYDLAKCSVGQLYQNPWGWAGQVTLLQKQTFTQECNGETTDCFLVFRVEGSDKVYKKLGKGDSYGDLEWDGALFPVAVREKMVTVWEVEE